LRNWEGGATANDVSPPPLTTSRNPKWLAFLLLLPHAVEEAAAVVAVAATITVAIMAKEERALV